MKLPPSWHFWPRPGPARWSIELEWELVAGRVEAVGIRIRPLALTYRDAPEADLSAAPVPAVEPLTAGLLREIPLGRLVAGERRAMSRRLRVSQADKRSVRQAQAQMVRDMRKAWREAQRTGSRSRLDLTDYLPEGKLTPGATAFLEALQRKGPGRKPYYGPDHFAEVARVYRQAWESGDPPTKAVMERGPGAPVSKATAAKWVARARALGFLEPTTRGKGGGVAQTKTTQPTRAKPNKSKATKKAVRRATTKRKRGRR